jgi:hypothetical protein
VEEGSPRLILFCRESFGAHSGNIVQS